MVVQAKSLGITFGGSGVVGVNWVHRMQVVHDRLQRISRIPNLSAFGRAFATNAYALSTLLYGAQYTASLPQEHGDTLQKWVAALVDAGLGPGEDLRRPPGIPQSCMAAHPTEGGFGLLPVRQHLFARLAVEAVQLLGESNAPWVIVGRSLVQKLLRAAPEAGAWQLALCSRQWLFPMGAEQPLPAPLRSLALGLRALPPLDYVAENSWAPGAWCWHAPLWSNPLVACREVWDWFGQQHEVAVGLECVVAPGLLSLPRLRSVGEAVLLLHELHRINSLPGGLPARRQVYGREVWGPSLQHRGQYSDRQLAIDHVQQLVDKLPPSWVAAARVELQSCLADGRALPVVDNASMGWVRARLCAGLGWKLGGDIVVRLAGLTVKLATRLQPLPAHDEIRARHAAFSLKVSLLDALLPAGPPPGGNPEVCSVLKRWWKLKVPNTYKETAWRLALDAFPTAARMQLPSAACVACGAAVPDVGHHFWQCTVAVAIRTELEQQLVAAGMAPNGGRIACSAVWVGCLPHVRMHRFVWDLVCLAAIHAFNVGRSAAWAVSRGVEAAAVVDSVAVKAAKAAFWDALAEFAATVHVPDWAQTADLTLQPFLAWHVVLQQGNGLRVVRV